MSDSNNSQPNLSKEHWQLSLSQSICNDCAFHTQIKGVIECIHPDELGVNCSTIIFCNSFQVAQEVESPCVSFGSDYGD